jgi:hypothetical protein
LISSQKANKPKHINASLVIHGAENPKSFFHPYEEAIGNANPFWTCFLQEYKFETL